jgi:hypothetical protein
LVRGFSPLPADRKLPLLLALGYFALSEGDRRQSEQDEERSDQI